MTASLPPTTYPHLLTPLGLGFTTLKNRVVIGSNSFSCLTISPKKRRLGA